MAIIREYNGKSPKIAEDAFIAENAVIIGDVEIGSQSNVWYGCTIRGDVNPIRIGAGTNIQDNTVIHVAARNGPVNIGNGVTIGHAALLHACVLHDFSFIGMGSKIIDYTIVESYSMVAAGALVTSNKIIKTGQLWAGVPAKFMRDLSDEEKQHIITSKDNYIRLSQTYLSSRSD